MLTFGTGILNSAINKLPVELHIPGYQYCGPGTHLSKRLARGDPGINPLDAACKEHDIAYSRYDNLKERHEADKILKEKAWQRVQKSSSLKERLAALAVVGAMKAKTKLGMGITKRKERVQRGKGIKKAFRDAVHKARVAIRPVKNVKDAIKIAMKAARAATGNKKGEMPGRIIPLPKTGGFLPLIPIFAALSALGALSGGAAGIAKAVNDASAAKEQLKEAERHNRAMEATSIHGQGLYLKPYKRGLGLYLSPTKNYQEGR